MKYPVEISHDIAEARKVLVLVKTLYLLLLLTYYRQLDLLANWWSGRDLTLVEASITTVQCVLDC